MVILLKTCTPHINSNWSDTVFKTATPIIASVFHRTVFCNVSLTYCAQKCRKCELLSGLWIAWQLFLEHLWRPTYARAVKLKVWFSPQWENLWKLQNTLLVDTRNPKTHTRRECAGDGDYNSMNVYFCASWDHCFYSPGKGIWQKSSTKTQIELSGT